MYISIYMYVCIIYTYIIYTLYIYIYICMGDHSYKIFVEKLDSVRSFFAIVCLAGPIRAHLCFRKVGSTQLHKCF